MSRLVRSRLLSSGLLHSQVRDEGVLESLVEPCYLIHKHRWCRDEDSLHIARLHQIVSAECHLELGPLNAFLSFVQVLSAKHGIIFFELPQLLFLLPQQYVHNFLREQSQHRTCRLTSSGATQAQYVIICCHYKLLQRGQLHLQVGDLLQNCQQLVLVFKFTELRDDIALTCVSLLLDCLVFRDHFDHFRSRRVQLPEAALEDILREVFRDQFWVVGSLVCDPGRF